MSKLVLFDIDGTILNSSRAGRDAMEAAIELEFGFRGDPNYHYDGKTDRQIIREILRSEGHEDGAINPRLDAVVDRYLGFLKDNLAQNERIVTAFPGVLELIDAVEGDSDTTIGLLTGNVQRGAFLKLGAVGIDGTRFVVNAFGCDSEIRNELSTLACQRHEEIFGEFCEGDDVIVIGDTPADIECGRPVNARTIAVATGRYSVDELNSHKPYAAFADLSNTRQVLEAIYA